MIGGWRKLHNEKLRKLNSSPTVISMVTSRGLRCAGRVRGIGRSGICLECWPESQRQTPIRGP
jgi:hypothetical protein